MTCSLVVFRLFSQVL